MMKKIMFALLALVLLPISAYAEDEVIHVTVDTPLEIGERVEIFIENDEKKQEFFVMRPSPAGEQYVWVLLNGNVMTPDGKSISVYDEPIPGDHEATATLENAVIYEVLENGTSTWRKAEPARLFDTTDLEALGITKGASGKYEIMQNRLFLSPIKQVYSGGPDEYNYWTQIEDTSAENTSVFAITLNENYNGDTLTPIATLESYDITQISTGAGAKEFVVRPIVKVDKQYIDCVYKAKTPTTTTINNVKTSETIMPAETLIILGIAVLGIILIRKKDIFNKI